MARFTVKMRNVTVGWSDLENRDSAMGVASGPFRSGPGYELVQPVFRLFAEATGDAPTTPVDEAKLARYYAARDRLGLALQAPDGTVIPTQAVHIVDFTPELGADAIQVEVFTASAVAWESLERLRLAAPDA